MDYSEIKNQAEAAIKELLEKANLKKGDIFIVGCSSSEVVGETIGKGSSPEAAKAIYEGIKPALDEKGVYLAAQCCEHLNRAVVIEKAALTPGQDIVNAIPQIHAGGSFAVTVYENAEEPVMVESVRASAGMDVGDTLIGMHLKPVVVPVRTEVKKIGNANLVCARTRPKYIGGERTVYL